MRRAVILIGILTSALALLASGCGGGDGDDGGSADPRSAVRDIQPEAQATAEAVLLELSDFPNDWRASPSESGQDTTNEFYECVGVDYSGFTITGEAESQGFAMGENAEASSESAVYESEQDAAAAFAEGAGGFGSTLAEDCVSDQLVSIIQEANPDGDYKIGEIELGELSFTPPGDAEEARAWQVAIPVETQGLSATVYIEFANLRKGNVLASLVTQDAGDPFDTALRDDLLAAIAARMSEASS
jgi:hypothetical protein